MTTPPDDNIDRLLASFFKAEMPHPWPGAPEPAAISEPSGLVAERTATTTDQPPARRDTGSKSRLTLAASVALLLGGCWILSNGFQTTSRPTNGNNSAPGVNLRDTTADGNTGLPGVLRDEKDKPVKPPVKVDNPFN